MSLRNPSPEHSAQEHLSAELCVRAPGVNVPLKLALALAIAKSRKAAASEARIWKRRALAHERHSKRFKTSLERLNLSSSAVQFLRGQRLLEALPAPVGDDTDVFDLGRSFWSNATRLQAAQSEREVAAGKKRTEALSHFLRNVHAVQFVEMLQGGEMLGRGPHPTVVDTVIDFAKSTLAAMPPSALRRAYSTNVVEFLERKCCQGNNQNEDTPRQEEDRDLAERIDDFVAWLVHMLSASESALGDNPPSVDDLHQFFSQEKSVQHKGLLGVGVPAAQGSCAEILLMLAPRSQLCNFVLAKTTSAIRKAAEALGGLFKELGSRQNTQLAGAGSFGRKVQQLFESSFPLFELQAKSLDAFSAQAKSPKDACFASTAVMEDVVGDVIVIHLQANELRTFLPLFFRMLTDCVAATISMLQDLATNDTNRDGGLLGPQGLNSKSRQLCGVLYDHLVQRPQFHSQHSV